MSISPQCRWLRRVAAVLITAAGLGPSIGPATAQSPPSGFVNQGLVGVGRLPAGLRDKFGETFGSGSGVAVDLKSWAKTTDGYGGTFYLLPDRGYNIEGTNDYRARLNKISVKFKPAEAAVAGSAGAEGNAITLTLEDTILLTDTAGEPMSGLDPAEGGVRPAAGAIPPLPQTASGRVALDAEAVVLLADGSFFVSDEYGPYIYHFSASGKMLSAIRPPEAVIPKRKGKDHFSANAPGAGAPTPDPAVPESGRQNNQGLEGLALTPDGKLLVAILQSATRQDGGDKPETRNYTRIFYYDVSNPDQARLVRHYAVSLPLFDADGKTRVAAQSELLALDESHFLLLCRDGNGFGTKNPRSLYRKVLVLDVTGATNLAGSKYDGMTPVAPGGKLESDVIAAKLTPFIDINDSAQLARFGLHNGAPNDRSNLSEKWEGMGLVPALDPAKPDDFFLMIANDNDFLTTDGFQAGASYKTPVDSDTVMLAYRVTLPALH
jgi:hypothetical protein